MAETSGPRSPPRRWRTFLPREHGSWSLALEPLALALIAAPSAAGLALAGAAVAAFLSRRPLALWWTGGRAAVATLLCALAALALLGWSSWLGPAGALVGLIVVAPPAALFVYFDTRRQGREEAAELAGALTFSILPALVAAQGGWSWVFAAALAFTAGLRSIPVVLTVRAFLRRKKGIAPAGAGRALGASALFACAALGLALTGILPWLIPVLAIVQVLRSAWLLGPLAPSWPASRLGVFEAVAGLAHVVLAGIAWRGFSRLL